MRKPRRKVRFLEAGNNLLYDTEIHGPWTLTEQSLSEPERKTHIVDIPGRDGELDLAPALSDGEPRYKNRELMLRFECSEGSREERSELIRDMTSRLSGRFCRIVLPDNPLYHLSGYADVQVEYNDINHAAITVSANVSPYFEANNVTQYDLPAAATMETVIIKNHGSRRVVPVLSAYAVAPAMPNITLRFGSTNMTITDYNSRLIEELAMEYMQAHSIRYMGSGNLVISFREAHL